jgi:hypothetical protein
MPKIDTNRKNSILLRLDTAFSIARLQLTSVGELNIKASLFIRRSDMKNMRVLLKPVGIFLAFFLFILSGPYQSAMAAMIGTEAVVDADGAQGAREYLNSFLAREDVRNALIAQIRGKPKTASTASPTKRHNMLPINSSSFLPAATFL